MTTTTNRIKTSFQVWKDNFLKFVIAEIPMAIVIGIVFSLFSLVVAMGIVIINPSITFVDAFMDYLTSWWPILTQGDITLLLPSLIISIIVPLYAIGVWFVFPIYGLVRSILFESTDFPIKPFDWLKRGKERYLITGIVLSLLSLAPGSITVVILTEIVGRPVVYPLDWIIGFIGLAIFFVMMGLLMMYVPSVVSGKGAIEGLVNSFNLVKSNIKEVFLMWLFYLFMLIVWFIPIVLHVFFFGFVTPGTDPFQSFLVAIAGLGAFFDGFVVLPMMIVGMTHLYDEINVK
ncbi:MAG: membrane protein of unknown function [Candidatus Thorarchaeota archaeon]|nr:MAG: membrane protein of unknown function [Candidatus Thorarchaeota archaeon]